MDLPPSYIETADEAMDAFRKAVPSSLMDERDSFFIMSCSPSVDGRIAVCIFGTRRTREEAEEYVSKLVQDNPKLTYLIGDCFHWLVCPPKFDEVNSIHSNNSHLDGILQNWANDIQKEGDSLKEKLEEAENRKKEEEPKIVEIV